MFYVLMVRAFIKSFFRSTCGAYADSVAVASRKKYVAVVPGLLLLLLPCYMLCPTHMRLVAEQHRVTQLLQGGKRRPKTNVSCKNHKFNAKCKNALRSAGLLLSDR